VKLLLFESPARCALPVADPPPILRISAKGIYRMAECSDQIHWLPLGPDNHLPLQATRMQKRGGNAAGRPRPPRAKTHKVDENRVGLASKATAGASTFRNLRSHLQGGHANRKFLSSCHTSGKSLIRAVSPVVPVIPA